MANPCLHIGLPKTGTTTLQRHLFERHSDVVFLGLFGHEYRDPRLEQLIDSVRKSSVESYDPDLSQALFRAAIEESDGSSRVTILSDERLTSRAYRENGQVKIIKAVEADTIAQRLHSLFGSWKILITLRNQYDLMWSWYLHDSRNMIVRPDDWIAAHLKDGEAGRFGALKYDEMAERYDKLFGHASVGVFAFEHMKNDVEGFAHAMSEFLAIDGEESARLLSGQRENVRVSHRMILYQRFRQGFFPNIDLHRLLPERMRQAGYWFLRRGQPTNIKMPNEWRPIIHDYYAKSNQRMQEISGLPLDKYGYPV